ncbi:hypothetical protein [Sinorhizobium meliloti]|nr:hypothetical protein [Sinorhizobium meliloti]
MKYYAGLDVSQQTTSICIVDEEGKTVAEPRAQRRLVKRLSRSR